jgi:hypothetical protein
VDKAFGHLFGLLASLDAPKDDHIREKLRLILALSNQKQAIVRKDKQS